ncbi:MAG: ferrous iron transport protein A [Endomicrobium sp.]|jgi:Fe2+ transport system protein FeoA|nr:ferrous iron transport protein A [Endomicrobium sp.]
MNLKFIVKLIYKKYCYVGNILRKNKKRYRKIEYSGTIKLSDAIPGKYKFVSMHCDRIFVHKLLEIGFINDEEIFIIYNTGLNGNVILKIKESKIALSNKIAKKIIIKC